MKNLKLFQIVQLKLVLQNESLCQFTCNADGHRGRVWISPVRSGWRGQPAEHSSNVFEIFHQNFSLPSINFSNIFLTILVAAVVAAAVSDIVATVVVSVGGVRGKGVVNDAVAAPVGAVVAVVIIIVVVAAMAAVLAADVDWVLH
jgi:hypothetical protein